MSSTDKIKIILGKKYSPLQVISAISLVVILFFYIFTVGSYFNITISPLENRVNIHKTFTEKIINDFTDNAIISYGACLWLGLSLKGRIRIFLPVAYCIIISLAVLMRIQTLFDVTALLSIPMISIFLIYNRLTTRKILYTSDLTLSYLGILGISISLYSIVITSLPLFIRSQESSPDFAYEIFLLFANLSSVLILVLAVTSPLKLFKKKFSQQENKSMPVTKFTENLTTKILCLLSIMILSIIITAIPHIVSVNPTNQQVGSDSPDYIIMINNLTQSSSTQEFFEKVFKNPSSSDRPFTTIFFYTLVKSVPASVSYTIDHLPMLLAPILVLTVFILTRELTSNDTSSLLASFLTAISYHTLIGTYSGIYANWFALIIAYSSFVFLIRFLKSPNKMTLFVYSTFLIISVFSHIYTWTVLVLFTGIFLTVMYRLNFYAKRSIAIIFIVLLSSVIIDFIRSILTGVAVGVEYDLGQAHATGIGQLSFLWSNLTYSMQNYAGGIFGNFIILLLGVYWVVRSNSRELSSIFVLIFLSISIIPIFFGNTIIQTRIFYDISFQIPAAIGLTYLIKKKNNMLSVISLCVWLLAIAIRFASNFYFVSPT